MSQTAVPANPAYSRSVMEGLLNQNVAAGAGTTVIKNQGPAILGTVIIQTAGTSGGTLTFYDSATGATGNVIASIIGGQAVNLRIALYWPALNGITAVGAANSPGVIVTYT